MCVTKLSIVRAHLQYYPTPIIRLGSSIGILLFASLILQVFTGIILTAMYSSAVQETLFLLHSFHRADYLDGWILQLLHSSGSSVLFILIYSHLMVKYSRARTQNPSNWISGILILLSWMIIAFFGYVLPWGQMSYWAMTVISSLLPKKVLVWLVGNYYLSSIHRILAIHYLLPFVSLILAIVHMLYLHQRGSVSVLSVSSDSHSFYPLVWFMDMCSLVTLLSVLIILCCYIILHNPTNALEVSLFNTPLFIEPEWYFLCYYTVLKSMPNVSMGELLILCMMIGMLSVSGRSSAFMDNTRIILTLLLLLTALGSMIPSDSTVKYGILSTLLLIITF